VTPRTTTRRWSGLAAVCALALALTGAGLGAAQAHLGNSSPRNSNPSTDGAAAPSGLDRTSVIVRLSNEPLTTSTAVNRSSNGQVKLTGSTTKNTRATLAAERNAFKSWLKTYAPKAKVTGEYDITLNAVAVRLNGSSVDALRAAPGVVSVGYQNTYTMTGHEDPDLARIDGVQGWAAAGATSVDDLPSTWAGYGVQVAIVDSGIDASHPCFDDEGFPATPQLGDQRFTNNKVIVARSFNNQTHRHGYTPEAIDSHGTHVSGTVACNLHTPAVVEGATIDYDPSGVAPGAQLGNYNVFPGDVGSARSEDILNALDAAAADGMDVVNMSLGGGYNGTQDLLTMAVDNLDRSGIVVAVAAGNSGPGYFTTGSPGSAERALTAGASTVGHYVGVPVSANGAQVSVAAVGDFPVPDVDLTAVLGVITNDAGSLSTACTGIGESLAGQIALVSRGACTFGTKVFNAEQAGAIGVIVVNSVPGDPIAMATDPAFTTTIPAVMSPLADRAALMALDGEKVTLGAQKDYVQTVNNDILAGFSSWGPVKVNYRVKPDVVAPGVNVLSSVPLHLCEDEDWADDVGCWAFFQGTSMATPHLAGMAAVVLDAHPEWEAWEVRSAIANTADIDGVLQTNAITVPETDVQKVGNGLADLDAAVNADVAFDRTTLTYGAVAVGSGKTLTETVSVTDLTGTGGTFPVSVIDSTGNGTFSASPSTVTLTAGGTKAITVTFQVNKGSVGATQAHLYVGDSHLALYAFLK